VPEARKVMSLKNKDDFLMHGVVLQNRVFRVAARAVPRETVAMFHVKPFSPVRAAMFHVKHFCVKARPDFGYARPNRAGRD
jgi:hypothetical protein